MLTPHLLLTFGCPGGMHIPEGNELLVSLVSVTARHCARHLFKRYDEQTHTNVIFRLPGDRDKHNLIFNESSGASFYTHPGQLGLQLRKESALLQQPPAPHSRAQGERGGEESYLVFFRYNLTLNIN